MTTVWQRAIGRNRYLYLGQDETAPPVREGRNDGLDLIRATGAALVMATHLFHNFGQHWLGPLAEGGWVGIHLFFPLSGYLLYRPFLTGRVNLGNYLIARAARLAPAYYLAFAVIAVLGWAGSAGSNPWPSLTFTNNLFQDATTFATWGASWTIGLEVSFYVALPLLARLPGWALIVACVVSFASASADPWVNQQLPVHFWAFGLGMLVARYQERLPSRWAWLPGLGLILYGTLANDAEPVALGTALAILWSVRNRPRMSWVRWPADLSYAVYLWHATLAAIVFQVVGGPPGVLLAIALTLAVAFASTVLVERPVLQLSAWVRRRNDEDVAGAALRARPASP